MSTISKLRGAQATWSLHQHSTYIQVSPSRHGSACTAPSTSSSAASYRFSTTKSQGRIWRRSYSVELTWSCSCDDVYLRRDRRVTGKPNSQSNVVEGVRRSFGMREKCELEYRRVSTIAIGDSVTYKKLLAGGSDSLSTKQRYKRLWSVQGIRENNGRAFFIQGLCLIGERVIFEPPDLDSSTFNKVPMSVYQTHLHGFLAIYKREILPPTRDLSAILAILWNSSVLEMASVAFILCIHIPVMGFPPL